MNIIQSSITRELFDSAAEQILSYCRAAPENGPILWGLCGGRSPLGLFQALIERMSALSPELMQRFHFFQVDERLFADHNQAMLEANFFAPLRERYQFSDQPFHNYPLPKSNTNEEILNSQLRYTTLLQKFGGRFHLCILGIGEDGHVAGLFPGHESVKAPEGGFLCYAASPKPPPGRMTASKSLLARSDLGVLLAIGEGKRQALANLLAKEGDVETCPAKVVLEMKSHLIITDQIL